MPTHQVMSRAGHEDDEKDSCNELRWHSLYNTDGPAAGDSAGRLGWSARLVGSAGRLGWSARLVGSAAVGCGVVVVGCGWLLWWACGGWW
jgi:hypothetical protein